MEGRHVKLNYPSLFRCVKLGSSEAETYPCYNTSNDIFNLSSDVFMISETNLLSKGLTFVQTPKISKEPIFGSN